MSTHSRYTETQITKKYKKSILVDQLISFIPIAMLIFAIKTLTQFLGSLGSVFILVLFIAIFGFYLTSDYFMNNSSFGKKIYGIEILMSDQTRKLSLLSVIMRRVMELTYNPLMNNDFNSLSEEINNSTNTCIVQKNRNT